MPTTLPERTLPPGRPIRRRGRGWPLVVLLLGLAAALFGFGRLAPDDPRDSVSPAAKADAHAAATAILDRCRPLLSTKGAYGKCLKNYASAYIHGEKPSGQ